MNDGTLYNHFMCGRYTLRRINLARFNARPDEGLFEEFTERPHFNIAPSQLAPIVRLDRHDAPVASLVRWGLIPHWAREMPKTQPINARSETVETSGMFRQAFARRRCIVMADGFYEWRVGSGKIKQPYFIHYEDDRPIGLAGLWERWRRPRAEGATDDPPPLDTFTIITTNASEDLKFLHERMPVILQPENYAAWLDRNTAAADAAKMLVPLPPQALRTYPVSPMVNSPRNDSPTNVECAASVLDEST